MDGSGARISNMMTRYFGRIKKFCLALKNLRSYENSLRSYSMRGEKFVLGYKQLLDIMSMRYQLENPGKDRRECDGMSRYRKSKEASQYAGRREPRTFTSS